MAPQRSGSLDLSGESGNVGVGATTLFVSGFHTALSQEGGDGPTTVGLSKT